jgi:hypothetical protein
MSRAAGAACSRLVHAEEDAAALQEGMKAILLAQSLD